MVEKKTAVIRLKRDYKDLIKEPLPNMRAAPSTNSMQLWHYIFIGQKDTPFEGGYYFGKIKFQDDYPFKPPHYSMHMDNGRFIVGKDICVSNSNYHADTWSPLWSVSGILTGFVAFFMDTSQTRFVGAHPKQCGKDYVKFARESKNQCLESPDICELFPDVIEQIRAEIAGETPTHTLPFPPEHYILNEKTAERKKSLELERKMYENDLAYDTYGEESELDEEMT